MSHGSRDGWQLGRRCMCACKGVAPRACLWWIAATWSPTIVITTVALQDNFRSSPCIRTLHASPPCDGVVCARGHSRVGLVEVLAPAVHRGPRVRLMWL